MTFEQAVKAKKYVRRYGKKWTKDQVVWFFVEVARVSEPPCQRKGPVDEAD